MERYAEYKDSGIGWIGEIPAGWRVGRISSLYEQRNEKVSDKDYQPLSVTMQGIVPQLETAAKTQDGDNRKLVMSGDFAINSRSDRRGSCGISSLDGSVSLITNVLKPLNRDAMDERFFGFLYKSEGFSDEYYKWGTGIVDDLWSTNWSRMKNICVPIPPENDQRDIANYLDAKAAEIDGLVVDQQKSINLLKEYRKAVISEAVTKGLDTSVPMKDSGTEWIGEIPEDWKVDKINRLFGKIGSGSTPSSSNSKYYDGTISWIQSGDLGIPALRSTAKKLTQAALDDISALTIYDAPFLVIAMYGASIGSTSISMIDACTNQACCVLAEPSMNMQYAAYAIIAAKQYIVDLGIGGTQPNVSQQLIKAFKLPVPGIEEQRLIANQLDIKTAEIDSLITDKQQLVDKLQEYRKSLISEAVTGKFKVPGVA